MTNIKLNLINKTGADCPSGVVIFRENLAASSADLPIAWLVIDNLKKDASYAFKYPIDLGVTATDVWGNFTPMLPAAAGQRFNVERTPSGDAPIYAGSSGSNSAIEVVNALQTDVISAIIYADDRAIAVKKNVAPGQKAVFEFKPTIWIGVASQVKQGYVMNEAIISNINTELSLLGIAQADIIMTGGGPGPNSTPFAFNLENIILC